MSSSPERGFWWWWGPPLGLMVLITIVSSMPGQNLPPVGAMGWDKVLHALEFFVLAALLYRALSHTPRCPHPTAIALAIAVAFGILDELHQSFVPGRFPDVFDAVADTVGAILGVASIRAWHHFRR